jgi:hypothetical protein
MLIAGGFQAAISARSYSAIDGADRQSYRFGQF